MVLKRKRSASELCSSPSASSTCSSSTFSFSSPPNAVSAPIFWDNSNVSRTLFNAPAHLNSRTMKRFRDGRPSEELVHQRTLNLLFSAQQNHHQQQPDSNSIQHDEPIPQTSNIPTQHSLHRFWAISSAPKAPTTNISTPTTACSGCEDCGANLEYGSGGDGMMDIDAASLACGACGKLVCFSCSVSNLGEQKRCLQCAGRARGWDDGAMQM